MSKKKDEQKIETIMEDTDLHQRIKELEALVKAGEERALDRVCKAMGISSAEIKEKEESKPDERKVRMWVGYPVDINGIKYKGDITVPIDTARVIQQALGDRRMRLLRELTGNNYILQELQGGGFAPKLIGQVDDSGERIA